jgi:adenylosuccinate synthase
LNERNAVIVGLQFGDEGKGRVSGYFVKDYDWSIRFNGGPNAGHTVYDNNDKEHKLHHLPAGAVLGKKVALDSGMVIDINGLKKELDSIGNEVDLYISYNVHVIKPEHIANDSSGSGIGSTKRGIAYVYSDRALRKGEQFRNHTKELEGYKKIFYDGLPPIGNGERALLESAQGIMLDVDYGCYPYVTSSSIMPSIAHKVTKTIGVMKAYTSRVGDGPPWNPDIEAIRILGNEYGTTTGRARKCTWLDVDQIDYAISIVQPDEIVVTKLDIFSTAANIFAYDRTFFNGLRCFKSLNEYKTFLLQRFPQIKWFSESPKGDLIKV